MMRAIFVAAAGFTLALAGCSGEPRKLPEPVEISGTVTTADGKPVKDVQLTMRPKGEGHPAGSPLAADGSFKLTTVPGEFMYFFVLSEDPKMDKGRAKAALAAVPAKYQEMNVEHTVSLSAGGGNKIQLK